MYAISQGNTTVPLRFLVVSSSDNKTGVTGLLAGSAPLEAAVTICRNNDNAFAAPNGTLSEIGFGVYELSANAVDAGQVGNLWLHVQPISGISDSSDFVYEVRPTPSQFVSSGGGVQNGGLVQIRRGFDYTVESGTAFAWTFGSSPDLAGCTIDIWDSLYSEEIGPASLAGAGTGTQTITLTLTAEVTSGLRAGGTSDRAYVIRAHFEDGTVSDIGEGQLQVL